jgi:succinate dehydrogenase/fumarate reductase flavoprotein subunit
VIVLATGGYAPIYLNTNNAPGITGDGQALAYEAGISLKDMEFVQFYPTARGRRGSRLLLYEKILAQKGVVIKTSGDEDIFKRYNISDPMTVTRDQLAQLMIMAARGGDTRGGKRGERKTIERLEIGPEDIWMDISSLTNEKARMLAPLLPKVYWKGQKRFKVTPTAHFCMGGIVIDDCGRTSVKGLFAIGEATAGAHGANRLGGNALAEIFTMGSMAGKIAGKYALQKAAKVSIRDACKAEIKRLQKLFYVKGVPSRLLIDELKAVMWDKVGIIREKNELEAALDHICAHWPQATITTTGQLITYLEFENMRLVAEMVSRAALVRNESRGSHFRTDFPEEDNDNWLKNVVICKGSAGMELLISTKNTRHVLYRAHENKRI